MSSEPDESQSAEDGSEMLPDEREVIAERAPDLDELDDEEYLNAEELGEELGFE